MNRPRRARARQIAARGEVKSHDPFELIHWLAIAQPDPSKPQAELMQNSLDAGASRVVTTRFREKGIPCLFIAVMSRPAASYEHF